VKHWTGDKKVADEASRLMKAKLAVLYDSNEQEDKSSKLEAIQAK